MPRAKFSLRERDRLTLINREALELRLRQQQLKEELAEIDQTLSALIEEFFEIHLRRQQHHLLPGEE